MLNYKLYLAEKISSVISSVDPNEIAMLMEYPPDSLIGDLSLPCFRLSKVLKKSPSEIASELKQKLTDNVIDDVVSQSGYLNIFLNKKHLVDTVTKGILTAGEQYGSQDIGQGKTVVIDYSSPNIAKPFHVAHLRSTVIGHALYQIFTFLGYNCVGINHLGDWGTQFGKLIVGYHLWGDDKNIQQNGIDELLRLYVKFHEEAEKDPALEDSARAWFVKMEQGDQEALALWKWFVEISMAEFQRIYQLLGVQFDSYTGESFYNDKMEQVIGELKEKHLLEEDEGAWLVRLDEFGMSPALMLKKDGSSLYHTRDVAAALFRKKKYDFDRAIYITDYAQNLHFQQCMKIVELMGYSWAKDIVHVAFGRVSIQGMSLSTRKGNVIKLEDLLQQAINKIRGIIEERTPNLENKEQVAQQVGVGAVIFNDLSSNRIKDIDFNWDKALNFEGETGPYVQYTYARTCTVINKAKLLSSSALHGGEMDAAQLLNTEAVRVIKELYLFTERVEQAMRKLEPSIIARYLVDLAQAFNHFYHECRVLVDDVPLREARLALVTCVQITLKNGLRLIGLQAPEQI
ncbi:arginine--tRNA ligase [Paenibacillus sp. N3.4]|nr:arginine--tRNA ligase [Paenibacillus sp. N3.4]